jgi:hypothetical protein
MRETRKGGKREEGRGKESQRVREKRREERERKRHTQSVLVSFIIHTHASTHIKQGIYMYSHCVSITNIGR